VALRSGHDGQRLDIFLHIARLKYSNLTRARPVLSSSEPDAQVVELPEVRLRRISLLYQEPTLCFLVQLGAHAMKQLKARDFEHPSPPYVLSETHTNAPGNMDH
jgi:hypothetical protein